MYIIILTQAIITAQVQDYLLQGYLMLRVAQIFNIF
jgi:hypothetical protein